MLTTIVLNPCNVITLIKFKSLEYLPPLPSDLFVSSAPILICFLVLHFFFIGIVLKRDFETAEATFKYIREEYDPKNKTKLKSAKKKKDTIKKKTKKPATKKVVAAKPDKAKAEPAKPGAASAPKAQ